MINTLRRFANKRPELQSETSRIETRLGAQFKQRSFTVIEGYEPKRTDNFNPGEIDLICVLDNTVLVIEVKSTYRRTSKREAIRYKHSALMKAGQQIKRKTEAVKYLLETDDTFRELLGIKKSDEFNLVGWIADTCLEYDHEYFNGYLKVSVEGLHIALRDETEMLVDSMALDASKVKHNELTTLYPQCFTVMEFVKVVQESNVWS